MLTGRFGDTTGRSYIEGRLSLPRLTISDDISFIIDTGGHKTRVAGRRREILWSIFERMGAGLAEPKAVTWCGLLGRVAESALRA
jgi:hypothetical protein